jgi:hypothetical protein
MITKAVSEGSLNTVHNEFSDGYIIGVFDDSDSYTPLIFEYNDILSGDKRSVILTTVTPYHDRLLRSDGGICISEKYTDIAYSWRVLEEFTLGLTHNPATGEYSPSTTEVLNEEIGALLCGAGGHETVIQRVDREYWTPNKTTVGVIEKEPFTELSLELINMDCYDIDNCGKVTYAE